MSKFSEELSRSIGGSGLIPDFDTVVFDMGGVSLSLGDKVLYNSKKGTLVCGYFIAVSDDPKDLANDRSHRKTCYIFIVENKCRPSLTKVSSCYLYKAEWNNLKVQSHVLTASYKLLNEIEEVFN